MFRSAAGVRVLTRSLAIQILITVTKCRNKILIEGPLLTGLFVIIVVVVVFLNNALCA